MTPFVPIPLPCGYEVLHSDVLAFIHSTTWAVPGGDPVYAHVAAATVAVTETELHWASLLARVMHHVATRQFRLVSYAKGVSIYTGCALSDRPPPNQQVINVSPILEIKATPDDAGTGSDNPQGTQPAG